MYKLLTFESWVTRKEWFQYAQKHPERIPYPLVDRSPCSDPFFDPFSSINDRRPLISGLCRGLRNFNIGDTYIYVTRVDRKIYKDLRLEDDGQGPLYFGVAALEISKLYSSHEEASAAYAPRQYVVNPSLTNYPPNLAFNPCHKSWPEVATHHESCITFDKENKPLTPEEATLEQWQYHCNVYYIRQKIKKLRAAECRVKSLLGQEALKLDVHAAPIFSPLDWGGRRLNVQGLRLDENTGQKLIRSIVAGGNAEEADTSSKREILLG